MFGSSCLLWWQLNVAWRPHFDTMGWHLHTHTFTHAQQMKTITTTMATAAATTTAFYVKAKPKWETLNRDHTYGNHIYGERFEGEFSFKH